MSRSMRSRRESDARDEDSDARYSDAHGCDPDVQDRKPELVYLVYRKRHLEGTPEDSFIYRDACRRAQERSQLHSFQIQFQTQLI